MKKFLKPALLIAAIAIMAFGMLQSGAWFTDTVATPQEAIASGTLSINDGNLATLDLGELTNMAPGDITGPVVVTIENNGTLPLVWIGDLVVEGNSALKEAIYIDNAKMEFIGWSEPEDQFITNGDGSGLYPATYHAMAVASAFHLVTLDKFDGTSAMGVAPYEFTGALMPGKAYRLTINFGFAPDAGNQYQGLGNLSLGFAVKATQNKTAAMQALQANMVNNAAWYQTQLNNQP